MDKQHNAVPLYVCLLIQMGKHFPTMGN